MVNFLTSRRLLISVTVANIIILACFMAFKFRKNLMNQKLAQCICKHDRISKDIILWEKHSSQIIPIIPFKPESLSQMLTEILQKYSLTSAVFTEIEDGFSLELGAKNDWILYVVMHVLQKRLQGLYILSYFQLVNNADGEGVKAILHWSQ